MKENWKPVVGYEGVYEVSDQGCVRSLDRRTEYRNVLRKGKTLTPHLGIRGYYTVVLYPVGGKPKTRYVHSLVAEAFVGPRPTAHDVCHGAAGKLNNSVDNLSYGSRRQNACDDLNRDRVFSSRYPGVGWSNKDKVWRAKIKFEGKTLHLGHFHDEHEAAKAYQKARQAISLGTHPADTR